MWTIFTIPVRQGIWSVSVYFFFFPLPSPPIQTVHTSNWTLTSGIFVFHCLTHTKVVFCDQPHYRLAYIFKFQRHFSQISWPRASLLLNCLILPHPMETPCVSGYLGSTFTPASSYSPLTIITVLPHTVLLESNRSAPTTNTEPISKLLFTRSRVSIFWLWVYNAWPSHWVSGRWWNWIRRIFFGGYVRIWWTYMRIPAPQVVVQRWLITYGRFFIWAPCLCSWSLIRVGRPLVWPTSSLVPHLGVHDLRGEHWTQAEEKGSLF